MFSLLQSRRRKARQAGGMLVPAMIGVVLLVLVGLGVFYYVSGPSTRAERDADEKTPQWVSVSRQTIPVQVSATGTLVARDQLDIINIIEHRDDPVVERVIDEGTWVKQGQWLVTLSAPSLISERDEMESRVREQEAEVEEARRNLAIEQDTMDSADAKAKLQVELAQLAYDQWENGTVPQKELELQLQLEKAERELDQARRELELSKELFEQKFISRTELEADEIRLIEAQNALQTANLAIAAYNEYGKVMEEKEMLSDIEQARAEYQRTQRKNENQLELLNARIDNEVNELEQRRLRFERFQRMADAIELTAPRDGLVIYGSTIGSGWDRRYPIRQGARVWGGRRVMVISDTTFMLARINVHESRIREIRPDQEVVIELVARPGLQLRGQVVSKSNAANSDSTSNPSLAEYAVTVSLPKNTEGLDLKPGMSASARIFIRNIDDALALPIQAVHTEGREHFVYVPAGANRVRRQNIQIGGTSETMVEVTGGIDEGVRVLMRNPRPGEVDKTTPDGEAAPQTAMNPS